MTRIPFRLRIFLTFFISFLLVKLLPPTLVNSPVIPTKADILQIFSLPRITLPSIKIDLFSQVVPTASPTTPDQTLPTTSNPEPTTFPFINPTQPQAVPTAVPTIPPAVPTTIVIPTDIIFPTFEAPQPTTRPNPTAIQPNPTAIPSPTTRPTDKPMPTAPATKVPNYAKLNDFVANTPMIGCKNGTITGCPVDTLYNTLLDKGLGWATYYGDEHKTGYNIVAEVIHNRKGISVDAALKFINDNYMQKQSDMTPEEARQTGKVIAYAATRTPQDLWKIKYVFGIDDPKNPQARFIGRIMIIDCAASNDWRNNLSTLTYSYKGWSRLNWIVDLSRNGFIQIPTGLSGRQDNVGEGRPGVILIDEASLNDLIY